MPDPDAGTPWLDVKGAAARALCSDGTILREARAGRLRGMVLRGPAQGVPGRSMKE